MPKVLAQSNLPKSAAVVVSSETIILRDPNNSILEKYTSDEQKEKSLKSYGIKPATMLTPGENPSNPRPTPPIVVSEFFYNDGTSILPILQNPPYNTEVVDSVIAAHAGDNDSVTVYSASPEDENFTTSTKATCFATELLEVKEGMYINIKSINALPSAPSAVFFDSGKNPLSPSVCCYGTTISNFVVPAGAKYIMLQTSYLRPTIKFSSSNNPLMLMTFD